MNVLITAINSPRLLTAQIRAIRKWVSGETRILVVNDAYNEEHFSNLWEKHTPMRISQAAKAAGVECLRFPQDWHNHRELVFPDEPIQFRDHNNANSRCADSVQYGTNILLRDSVPLLILDADMIPVSEFNPEKLLSQHPVWGVPWEVEGFNFLWNGIILIDPAKAERMDLFNLDCGQIQGVGVDVGGMLHQFVKENEWKIGEFQRIVGGYGPYELCAGAFAHLRAGGNWEVHEVSAANDRVDRFIEAVS